MLVIKAVTFTIFEILQNCQIGTSHMQNFPTEGIVLNIFQIHSKGCNIPVLQHHWH